MVALTLSDSCNLDKESFSAMKLLLLYGLSLLFAWKFCSTNNPQAASLNNPAIILNDTIQFSKDVQPILVKKCSPCHFPGGKMYVRMPFDKDTTIINHEAGILKRIKGDDNLIIKTFIQQSRKENNEK